MRSWWISIALLGACGGSSKQAAEPMPAGPSCKSASEHIVDELAASLDPRPPDDVMNSQIALIRNRCEQDAWSLEAQQCLAAMKGKEDADRCGALLTPAQQEALVRDQSAAMGDKAAEPAPVEAAPAPGAAAPPPPPTPAAAPAQAPSAPATRGPKQKGGARTEDPDQGGE